MAEHITSASGIAYPLIINSDGSINVSGTMALSGAIHIGSVSANVDAVYVQSGDNINLGTTWSDTGSIVVSGAIIGSVGITTTPLPVSGVTFPGSVSQVTSPWSVTGSVELYNVGSIVSLGSIEIYQTTAADMQVDIGNIGSIAVTTTPIPISGDFIGVSGTSLLVSGAGTFTVDCNSSNVTVDNTGGLSAVSVQDGGNSITVDQSTASNLKTEPAGQVAHDAVDSGNPVKIGAKAIDYEPDATGEQGFAEVASNDRANIATNLRGEIIPAVKSEYNEPTNIDTTYDDDPTTATSGWIECWQYRKATFGFELDKANTPTDILIEIEVDLGDGNAKKLMNDFLGDWRYDDTAVGTGIEEAITFDIAADRIRIKVTCTGTDATNTFTMANSVLLLRT